MKIAFLIERLDRSRGGAETYAGDFTRMLVAEGHEVHVFSRCDAVVDKGVTLRPVPVRGVGRSGHTLSFARLVEKMLSVEAFDVVHGVGWTVSQDVYQPHGGVHRATLAANVRATKCLSRLLKRIGYRLSPKQAVFRRIERRQYLDNPARVFVALSEMVRRDMQTFYDVPDEKIEVVYNGVDTERFHPHNAETHRESLRERYGIGDGEVVFLVVAHNFRLKGVPELVACVTKDLPRCRLVVVGRNRMQKGLKASAESRAPGRVVFTGAVPDTVPYYAAADVYVHPTYYDPCSLVVLEALASGLPVVTSTMNGASELMTDGVEGYVVKPGAGPELAERMHRLFDTPLRNKMGRAARALAEKHTLRHNYREMMAAYEQVLRRKGLQR